jgi:hypothetical protein
MQLQVQCSRLPVPAYICSCCCCVKVARGCFNCAGPASTRQHDTHVLYPDPQKPYIAVVTVSAAQAARGGLQHLLQLRLAAIRSKLLLSPLDVPARCSRCTQLICS